MLALGDKVEIMGQYGNMNAVKFGKVVQINTRTKPEPAAVNSLGRDSEHFYSVKLGNGEVMNYLTEPKLRKV
jgi:hypothetical protein